VGASRIAGERLSCVGVRKHGSPLEPRPPESGAEVFVREGLALSAPAVFGDVARAARLLAVDERVLAEAGAEEASERLLGQIDLLAFRTAPPLPNETTIAFERQRQGVKAWALLDRLALPIDAAPASRELDLDKFASGDEPF
jgi:hypothetical protein